MKVIFLDIDGVLNTELFINSFFAVCKRIKILHPEFDIPPQEVMRDDYGQMFCPTACNLLNWIVESTQADIVISSTWRHSGLSVMQEMWLKRGLPGRIIDVTPIRRIRGDGDFKLRAERGNEIKEWLQNNPVDAYCIIDDDNDMLPEQEPYFIQVDAMYGITMRAAEKAIAILTPS